MQGGGKPYEADAKQFGNAMGQIAHGQAMMAAIRDYSKEVETAQSALAGQADQAATYDMADLVDDPELQKLHADRMAQLQQERERRAEMQQKGHGTYTEIEEGDFLEVVTKSHLVVVHFFHREFERCKIMDKHLGDLSRRYFKTRFTKMHAPDSPFFTIKLNIKMLPCVLAFRDGINVSRIVGFDGLCTKDDFPTHVLEERLLEMGVIEETARRPEDEDQHIDAAGGKIRKGFSTYAKTASDEDSDFD